jgi:hypothetical protein
MLWFTSYAGGRNPWKDEAVQSYDDGKLEILGFHAKDFVFLHIGGHGEKISQAHTIRIKTKKSMPMQVDGEPVLLKTAEISICRKNKVFMIQSGNFENKNCLVCSL